MTSRRPITSQANDAPAPSKATPLSDAAPGVPAAVVYKLLGFTALMIAAPITTYFVALNTITDGNSTWAGGIAAVSANIVLFAYIVVAVLEDKGDPPAEKKGGKAE